MLNFFLKRKHIIEDIKENDDEKHGSFCVGPTDIIFCGNPGVGKSTLLSCISGCRFESGLSFGSGLTSELKFQDDPVNKNLRWADTPGLADLTMAEKAALAIGKALKSAAKEKRRVKVFFVITSEWIKPADNLTINKVVGCINLPNKSKEKRNSFGIIVNKCSWLGTKREEEGKAELSKIFEAKSEINLFPTSFVHFLPRVAQLVDKSDAKYNFESLVSWMNIMDGMIEVESVDDIDVSNIGEQLEKQQKIHEEQMLILQKRIHENDETLRKELSKQREDFLKKLSDHEKLNLEEHKKRLIEMEKNKQSSQMLNQTQKRVEEAINTINDLNNKLQIMQNLSALLQFGYVL